MVEQAERLREAVVETPGRRRERPRARPAVSTTLAEGSLLNHRSPRPSPVVEQAERPREAVVETPERRRERDPCPQAGNGLVRRPAASGTAPRMPWTYILRCADDSYYVGSTTDLERRLWEHDEGLGSTYTRPARRRPVELVWSASYERIEDAFLYETQIQGWGRAKREALIEGRFELLPALARGHNRRPLLDDDASAAEEPEPPGEET
ncbi:hypothetical protein GCM10023340_22060 [Nocardioides marinquilinus]|uniref:GIY-YIG domain-containing protein n=1 Tax=Nocardioides marinquilinus TaxID=1210400 RepID=A0ABP9PKV0_9ACTN